MSNLKIGTRLALGFAVMAVFMAIITFFAVSSFSTFHSQVDVISKDKWPKTVLLHRVNDKHNEVARALRNAILLADPSMAQKEVARVAKAAEEVTATLDQLEKTVTDERDRELLKNIR